MTHKLQIIVIYIQLLPTVFEWLNSNLRRCKSLGSGRLDAALIENCCSELELYIGVEPNEHMFDTLCTTVKGLQGVKVIQSQFFSHEKFQHIKHAVTLWP